MLLSDRLKDHLAKKVYNNVKQVHILNAIKKWEELTLEERRQAAQSYQVILSGLGSNEVGQAWYERSGQLPKVLWEQLNKDIDTSTSWQFSALHLISALVALAEVGLIILEEREEEKKQD